MRHCFLVTTPNDIKIPVGPYVRVTGIPAAPPGSHHADPERSGIRNRGQKERIPLPENAPPFFAGHDVSA